MEVLMAKKVIVIGAGVAGLSAASFLQRNGYETEICESHSVSGGFCTAWRRRGFTFDGCIHWLVGSGPAHPLHHVWNELLDMQSLEFIEMDDFARVDDDQGNSFTLYADADRLDAELRRLAPRHAEPIREITDGVKLMARDDTADPALKKRKEAFSAQWGPVTTAQFARMLESPFLEYALGVLFGPGSIVALPWLMSVFHLRSSGYPIGGSLAFVKAIEKRYRELGGRIRHNARVAGILVRDDRACGVRLENGEELPADIVVSAADGRATIFDLLEGKYGNDQIRGFYADQNPVLKPHASWVQVSLGVSRSLADAPHQLMWKPARPLVLDPETKLEVLGARLYNFDPTLAPAGHTVVIAVLNTMAADYWQDLRRSDRTAYEAEKRRVADEFVTRLDEKLGDIKGRIAEVDVSTPATAIRYTGSWRGSYMGWGWGTQVPVGVQRELPGLANFFMTGQWVASSGGLPPAMTDGRGCAALICERDGKKFSGAVKG
jgi:phytoene dehydrogenase-like protein